MHYHFVDQRVVLCFSIDQQFANSLWIYKRTSMLKKSACIYIYIYSFPFLSSNKQQQKKKKDLSKKKKKKAKFYFAPLIYLSQQWHSRFELYEYRNSLKNLSLNNSRFLPRKPEILSPSLLDFSALILSPVAPLITTPSPLTNPPPEALLWTLEAKEKSIKEKSFFLHPLLAPTPRDSVCSLPSLLLLQSFRCYFLLYLELL